VVVFIHGGGWQGGSKAAGKAWLQSLVASGNYAGASIGYRLSGEARWPAPIHDAKAAIRWLRAHAAELGLDARHIGAVGVSAGGTIAVLLGVAGDVAELEGAVGQHVGVDSRVQAVANLYGRINFLAEPESARAAPDQAVALNQRLKQLFGGTLEEKRDVARAASPVTHVSAGDAPVLTLHGTADALVPIAQAEELDVALRRAGVEHRFVRMVGFGHGFQNAEGNRRAGQFFDRHLRGVATDVSVEPIVAAAKK
jgi:acetyl esterase/lipase